jgi:lipopolysaccharide export system protein LptA
LQNPVELLYCQGINDASRSPPKRTGYSNFTITEYSWEGAMLRRRFTSLTTEHIRLVWTIAFIAVAVLIPGGANAAGESAGKADTTAENDPIQITADKLISNNEKKYAEFIGNVKATQADYVITSNTLRIYYRGELLNTDEKGNGEEKLKKIIASGDVKITTEQFEAVTDSAEWDTTAKTIILAGENSKIISGKNSITGSKIILYQEDGRVKVEGSKNQRIKAVFYSEGKASNAFTIGKPKE